MKKHHFFNMYFTTTISITLVLFVVGLVCAMALISNNLSKQLRENVAVTLVLSDSTTTHDLNRLQELMRVAPFAKSYRYISKDEALKEHMATLGENPAEFLGYNPLQASLEVKLQSNYAHADSVKHIETRLKVFPCIENILYQEDMMDAIDSNVQTITWILVIVAAALLLISLALINNTIRLGIYSKRFLIHTMRLVGATAWKIRAPFVRKNIGMGLLASVLALAMLAGAAYYLQMHSGIGGIWQNWELLGITAAVVLLTGVMLTLLASYFAVGKYIKMKSNDLYYI